ncbi:uncharacterized protein LOC135138184 [Zophobas morio]|uniref:uncharacterized protein LOC135138184 n=1 Tax=Zophobas morio TaxID=2755281 RepID=UPI0030833FC5
MPTIMSKFLSKTELTLNINRTILSRALFSAALFAFIYKFVFPQIVRRDPTTSNKNPVEENIQGQNDPKPKLSKRQFLRNAIPAFARQLLRQFSTIIPSFFNDEVRPMVKKEELYGKSENSREISWSRKTFKKRSGTTDKGKDYELYFLAYMALKLTQNDKINNFLISSNNGDFGDFDDVVLEIDNPGETYAIQLKHVQRSKSISLEELTTASPKANFGITKYFKSFKKEAALKKCKLFLMTNIDLGVHGTFSINTIDKQEIKVEVRETECPLDIFNISQKAKCYQFQILESDNVEELTNEVRDYKTFFEHFFIYSKQLNLDELKKTIISEFELLVPETARDVYPQYIISFIREWNTIEKEKEKLDKIMMERLLVLQIATPSICSLSFETTNNNSENTKYLQQAISKFHLTVFKSDSYEKVRSLWSNIKDDFNNKASINELNEVGKKYRIKMEPVKKISELTDTECAKLLWLMNKCPLILKESVCVYKAINICKDRTFVLLTTNFKEKEVVNGSAFAHLSNIEDNDDLTNLKTKFECQIKSQRIKLEELIKDDKKFRELISTDILLEMVQGPYEVQESKETTQELETETWNNYVSRYLSRTFVDSKYLENIKSDTTILVSSLNDENINCLKGMLELPHNVNSNEHVTSPNEEYEVLTDKPTIYVSKSKISSQDFRKFCEDRNNVKNCHHFKLDHEDKTLEWIQTKGDISALQQFRIYGKSGKNIAETELSELHTDNNLHVIADDPGMGKTYFLKKLKRDASLFAIVISRKDILSFYASGQSKTPMEDFLIKSKFNIRTDFDSCFLEYMAKRGRIMYLWDGLDEIPKAALTEVIDTILRIAKGPSIQWITCRTHLEKLLEEKLGVLCKRTIRLTIDQQQQYMEKSLERREKSFAQISKKIIFAGHQDMFGNPLQLFIITMLLKNNFEKYSTKLDNLKVITNLYRYFVEEKFRLSNQEKAELKIAADQYQQQVFEDSKKARAKDYQEAALKILLDENTFNQLNLNCDDFLSDIASKGDYAGFISSVTENKYPIFVNNSYVEYFAADYLVNNRKNIPNTELIISNVKHGNVRLFFDMMLAHKCPAHIAVLDQDLKALKQYGREELCRKDDEGRNALQLACTRGPRFPVLQIVKRNKTYCIDDYSDYSYETNTKYEEILKYLLSHFQKQELVDMNCLSYAQKYDCLFVVATIIQTCRTKFTTVSDETVCSILYYCVKYERRDIISLLEKSEHVLNIASSAKQWLFFACQNGDEKFVNILLDFGMDLNCVDEDERTPLYLAASRGHDQITKLLLDKGAKLETLCHNKNTLLHAACESGNEVLVEDFLKRGLNINACNVEDITPLHLACFNGSEEAVKVLINHKANLSAIDKDGRSPLYLALLENKRKTASLLIESGVDVNAVNEEGRTMLHLVSETGHTENNQERIVTGLVKFGAEINRGDHDGGTPLYVASWNGHNKTVECLVKCEADINHANNDEDTPLYAASKNGHEETVECLMKYGAEINCPNKYGCTPLYAASEKGHEQVVESLVKYGADINSADKVNQTPLYIASSKGYEKTVECLVKYGAEVNRADNSGRTPLYIASWNGHARIVECLAKCGAEINCAKNDGWTPLYAASVNGHENIIESLVKYGAEINRADDDGRTPLYVVCLKGRQKTVECLVKWGADVNCANKNGWTPLYAASLNGHEIIVENLVEHGSEINRVTSDGKTPLDAAIGGNRKKIISFLKSKGAKRNVTEDTDN